MISQKENRLLTEAQAGTPAGALLRSYWQPAALTEELKGDRPVVAVTLMGERLILFRDERGRYGLMERHCLHRGADLYFGRLEDCGIRCLFHGWLFDVDGKCLEQPAEPAGSRMHERVRQRAYPCREKNGIVFAYLGEGEPPPFPDFDCFTAPAEYTFAFKGLWECNWLQALEVGIDPAHASFLHRFFEDEDTDGAYGKQFRDEAADSGVPLTRVLREQFRPTIGTEDTDYGFRLVTTRDLEGGRRHYRITNLVFPNAIAIPMSRDMTITQWHVPVDNRSCYWYAIFTSFGAPVDRTLMRQQRLQLYTLPDYRARLNRDNDYGFNPAEQRSQTYTGMGMDINVHDQWAVESQGEIQDRTQEHLGKSDVGISRYRRLFKGAIETVQQAGTAPFRSPAAPGPAAVDAIGAADNPGCWQELDRQRRAGAPWAGNARTAAR